MRGFSNAKSGDIVTAIAERVIANRSYLSDIDGLIGDGDHGVNMAKAVLDDHNLSAGTEVAVLISGLGATPTDELYILYDTIDEEVRARGLKVARSYVGNFFTSLEMVGVTLTIMALDEELKKLLDLEVACPAPL